jgi:hypothetical protein
LAQRLLVNHAKRQTDGDRQIGIKRLATLRFAALGTPTSRHLWAQPNRHVATLTQAFIVGGPVRDAICFFSNL